MYKVNIDPRIMKALGLNVAEQRVFEALISYPAARRVKTIMEVVSLPRATVVGILKRFEGRGLVERSGAIVGKGEVWKYKKGLEKFEFQLMREPKRGFEDDEFDQNEFGQTESEDMGAQSGESAQTSEGTQTPNKSTVGNEIASQEW